MGLCVFARSADPVFTWRGARVGAPAPFEDAASARPTHVAAWLAERDALPARRFYA